MADDPRRAIFAQWRRVPEADTSAPVVPPQLRTRRASPSYHYQRQQQQQQQSRPPAPPLATTAPRSYTRPPAQPLVHSRPVGTQYAVESGRARPSNGYADGTATNPNQSENSRKGPTQSPLNPQRVPPPQRRIETATSSPAQHTRETSERDAYRRQREKQRDLELQLARMMEAHGGSGLDTHASTGATAYRELVSPARPMRPVPLMANDGAFPTDPEAGLGDLGVPSTAFGRGRRVAPSDVMQELDDDFRRSFDEHQRPAAESHSVESAVNEDDEEDDGDAFDEEATGERERSANARPSPPPGMEVRVQNPMPPFREEISSDLSSDPTPHAARSPPPSMDSDGDPYVSTHVPTSEDIGAHFPMSSDFDYIPSISKTPPASPSHHHHQSTNGSASAAASSPEEQREEMDQRRPTKTSGDRAVFSTWSVGFLAGCVAVGFGGLFMEELMQLTGVFLHTSPFTLSRLEQREMSRRLDLLQQELQSFRVAAHEVEQQSQRMVHEVRAHLERMKNERERHQQMISKEMEALRKYVQAVTNELVEDEKHEIRKRLLETITDTVVELPDDLEEDEANGSTRIQSEMPINDSEVEPAVEVVEIALSVAEGTAVSFFEGVEDAEVMEQIQQAVAGVPNAVHEQVVPETVPIGANGDSATTSLVSMELVFLLAGVALIAGIVGVRVRNAHRRKSVFLRRKPPSFLNRFGAKRQPTTTATTTTDESDVETVAFFRGDSDGEASFSRFSGQSEDDVGSEYSEEQKEGDAEDDYESHGADDESGSLASSGTDFAFEPAEMNGGVSNHSDVESLDESRSSSLDGYPTPARGTAYPHMQQKLKDRLVDESPSTRRSPRIQRRSNLSTMR